MNSARIVRRARCPRKRDGRGVVPESPAAKAGIREKDIVLSLNSQKLDADHPIQDFLENLNVGDVVTLRVLRGKKNLPAKATLTERK